jgi:uncharacterized protein (TIGR00106 family)
VFRGHERELIMRVIVDLCVVPLGVGVSVSREVAQCHDILRRAGLKTHLHAYGTNIEGDWDDVFAAVKQCHETLHAQGVPRISSTLRLGTRVDRAQTLEDKIRSVEAKVREPGPAGQ